MFPTNNFRFTTSEDKNFEMRVYSSFINTFYFSNGKTVTGVCNCLGDMIVNFTPWQTTFLLQYEGKDLRIAYVIRFNLRELFITLNILNSASMTEQNIFHQQYVSIDFCNCANSPILRNLFSWSMSLISRYDLTLHISILCSIFVNYCNPLFSFWYYYELTNCWIAP